MASHRGKPLSESEPGETLVVLRVRDSDPEALRYLARIGMLLDVELIVEDKQPFNGPLTLSIAGKTHSVGRELAGHVFVEAQRKEVD